MPKITENRVFWHMELVCEVERNRIVFYFFRLWDSFTFGIVEDIRIRKDKCNRAQVVGSELKQRF